MTSENFNLHNVVEKLRTRDPLPPLVPTGVWNDDISRWLNGISLDDFLKSSKYDGDYAELTRAILYLWNDDLDKAHKIAQDSENITANYVHAIMHRREPDYGNSKHWFNRVGKHPNFNLMHNEFPDWEPLNFVDWCEAAEKGKVIKDVAWLLHAQHVEIELLYEFTREHALI